MSHEKKKRKKKRERKKKKIKTFQVKLKISKKRYSIFFSKNPVKKRSADYRVNKLNLNQKTYFYHFFVSFSDICSLSTTYGILEKMSQFRLRFRRVKKKINSKIFNCRTKLRCFSVACTRLYNSLCLSVGRSVCP